MTRFLLASLLILGLTSCSKRASKTPDTIFTLVGKWKYVSYFMSSGGPIVTTPAEPKNQFVLFNADGSFSSDVTAFAPYKIYTVVDSTKVRLVSSGVIAGSKDYFYYYNRAEGFLVLSQVEPRCIEGCGYNFTRW